MLNPQANPTLEVLYKCVKYPRITIEPDLKILVNVPLSFTHNQTQNFIQSHQSWIDKTLAKLQAHADILHREILAHEGEILCFGVWIPILDLLSLADLNSHRFSTQLISDSHPDSTPSPTALSSHPKSSNTLRIYLKTQLQAYILPQITHYSKLMGVQYSEVKITNALGKFGSCTHNNRLFFSFMLVFAPKDLIDYVIIHELAHIRYKNHSKTFWDFVQAHCPDFKLKRATLRHQARIYPLLLEKLQDFRF